MICISGLVKPSWVKNYLSWIFSSEYFHCISLITCDDLRDLVPVLQFKDYLRYKTTSQSVSSEAQVNNFIISKKSSVLFSRYSSFCIFNHPMIYQICYVMVSISTWDRVHFWIFLLNHNSLSHQTWPIDRY